MQHVAAEAYISQVVTGHPYAGHDCSASTRPCARAGANALYSCVCFKQTHTRLTMQITRVMHVTLVSMHVTPVSMHVTLVSMHVTLVSMHVTPVSMHVTLVSMHVTPVSMHVTLVSMHAQVVLEVPSLWLDLPMARNLANLPALRRLRVSFSSIKFALGECVTLPQVSHLAIQSIAAPVDGGEVTVRLACMYTWMCTFACVACA